jgi:hypothetical protein
MLKSITNLDEPLRLLSQCARDLGLTDGEWASRAGVRKETLSRLRRRDDCDLRTLRALAAAVGAGLALHFLTVPTTTADGHLPMSLDRDYEDKLLSLIASRSFDAEAWATQGARFFMAGLAVLLASVRGLNRRSYLELGERLHPGITEVAVFDRWLARSPLRPARFLPMLEARVGNAA